MCRQYNRKVTDDVTSVNKWVFIDGHTSLPVHISHQLVLLFTVEPHFRNAKKNSNQAFDQKFAI